ncbi:POZ domain-containing protein [Mytilinidion resinicola]|uniref:Elongin-C n=1 Tax=Mytilinidion resinicola TaxID=574789 RepID=A0A6A6Y8G6_9PEZI|nr:POZ domain-containing protein [Mytilinidion resinicola]KAF2804853.1 POZ domain-containing protein [Mytilinidion resinicola]
MALNDEGQTNYVTLVSSDGFEFKILRSAACIAPTIKNMLNPATGWQEARENRCIFKDINGIVLEKICEYLYYNEKYENCKDIPDLDIPPELCLELVMAADYLQGMASRRRLAKELVLSAMQFDRLTRFLNTLDLTC